MEKVSSFLVHAAEQLAIGQADFDAFIVPPLRLIGVQDSLPQIDGSSSASGRRTQVRAQAASRPPNIWQPLQPADPKTNARPAAESPAGAFSGAALPSRARRYATIWAASRWGMGNAGISVPGMPRMMLRVSSASEPPGAPSSRGQVRSAPALRISSVTGRAGFLEQDLAGGYICFRRRLLRDRDRRERGEPETPARKGKLTA